MRKALFSVTPFCLFLIAANAFAISKPAKPYRIHRSAYKEEKPSVSKAFYGETEGQKIYQYTLKNSKGMLVKVINYGATITDIITPDKNNEMGNVVLGFDSLKQYSSKENARMGAIRGRVVNKVANSKF